ncbi:MAG: STAS domain-containing protein [Armatimonadota bacterium]|nr:STAS domain-containing protein [Armatimonadota bacterium]MDR7449785.1 STAS domain-containing protein [Armatimonadota bacterium]MDR7458422.1 STAS domain-containing protein [Armatimonadota bacterium]MDR7478776.1 STAS domain-containing protein [Armatimonadota bacterium]MDR7488234.1 STAS domain-containing protein [Armatimonadota bacterium]
MTDWLLTPPLTASEPLAWQVSRIGEAALLRVDGAIDLSTVYLFRVALRRGRAVSPTVIVDLSGVSFVDLAAVQALEHAYHRWHRTGGRLIVVASAPRVRRMLEFVHGRRFLVVTPSVGMALQLLGQEAGAETGADGTRPAGR